MHNNIEVLDVIFIFNFAYFDLKKTFFILLLLYNVCSTLCYLSGVYLAFFVIYQLENDKYLFLNMPHTLRF